MRTRKRKVLSFILALCMVFGMFAMMPGMTQKAYAADAYVRIADKNNPGEDEIVELTPGGKTWWKNDGTSGGGGNNGGDYNIYYSASQDTVYLKSAHIKISEKAGLELSGVATVILEDDDSYIDSEDSSEVLHCRGNVTIKGKSSGVGTLKISVDGEPEDGYSDGDAMLRGNGRLVIDGVKFEVSNDGDDYYMDPYYYGISVQDLLITGGAEVSVYHMGRGACISAQTVAINRASSLYAKNDYDLPFNTTTNLSRGQAIKCGTFVMEGKGTSIDLRKKGKTATMLLDANVKRVNTRYRYKYENIDWKTASSVITFQGNSGLTSLQIEVTESYYELDRFETDDVYIPEAVLGSLYNQTVNVSLYPKYVWGTNFPFTYSSDDLPSWLTLDPDTGVITGKRTVESDRTTAHVTVKDSDGNSVTLNVIIGATINGNFLSGVNIELYTKCRAYAKPNKPSIGFIPGYPSGNSTISKYVWQEVDDDGMPVKTLGAGDTYEYGKKYRLTVTAKPWKGYYYTMDETFGGYSTQIFPAAYAVLNLSYSYNEKNEYMTIVSQDNHHITAYTRDFEVLPAEIDDVVLTRRYPQAGENPWEPAFKEDPAAHCTIQSYEWVEKDTGTVLGSTDTFEEGKTYQLRINCKADETYIFRIGHVKFYFGGVGNKEHYIGTGLEIGEEKKEVTATYEFTVDSTANSPLEVTVTEPVVGEHPENPTLAGDTGYTLYTNRPAGWIDVTDPDRDNWIRLKEDDTFAAGRTYRIVVGVNLKYDGDEVTAKINSQPGRHTLTTSAFGGYKSFFVRDFVTPGGFVPVTDITGVRNTATVGEALNLYGNVEPGNATNKTIEWSLTDAGATNAALTGNTLTATSPGTVKILATVKNGASETTDYTKEFEIEVKEAADPVLIGSVDVKVTAPAAGAIPDSSALTDTEGVTVFTPAWDPADNPFLPDKEYTVDIQMECGAAYRFTEATKFTINGQPAKLVSPGGESFETQEVKIGFTFPKTQSHEHDYDTKHDSSDHWKVCSICGEIADKEAHTFGDWTKPSDDDAVKRHTHSCTVCGYQESEECTFGDWTVTKQPTATENGEKQRTCTECGYVEKAEIPAGDHIHTLVYHKEESESCLKDGVRAHWECSECGMKFSDEEGKNVVSDAEIRIPAYGSHQYEDTVTEPTCTEKGYTTHTCKRCGDTYKDAETAALGHDYKETVTAPTCTEKGYTEHTCGRCGDSYKDAETDALGHDYSVDWTSDGTGHWHVCSRCGAKSAVEAHKFGDWVHTGSHTHECTACGYKETEECTFGDWTVTKQPTAKAKGEKQRTCSKCGYVEKAEVAATGTTDPDSSKPTDPDSGNSSKPDSNNPKTGDSSHLALWIVLMLAAAGAICACAFGSRGFHVSRKRKATEK